MNVSLRSLALAATLIIGWSAAANAALVEAPLDCAEGGVALNPATYDSCDGAFLGNDANQDFENEINGLFGTTGTWSVFAKAEEGSWSDGVLSILTGQGDQTGTFSVVGLPSSAVFVIKAANCFSAYYFTGIGSPASGSFDTAAAGLLTGSGCDGKNNPGISHLTVYTGGPDVAPIPLPASALLLIAGIGGLGALRASRRKA